MKRQLHAPRVDLEIPSPQRILRFQWTFRPIGPSLTKSFMYYTRLKRLKDTS